MKIALLMFSASVFVLPFLAGAQSPSVSSHPVDSAAVFAFVKTKRAGISAEELRNGQRVIARSEADTSHFNIGAHVGHALVGTIFGTLGGAVLGAGIGYYIDTHDRSGDIMIPATAILGVYGAIGGAAVGLLVGAFWPTK
jgi:hypothetical protein